MNGAGYPETADMAGMSSEYIQRQMADYKRGVRTAGGVDGRIYPNSMPAIAKALSDDEIRQVADWFASLKPVAFTRVVETTMVPKSFVGGAFMRFAQSGGEMEPIGNRIIALPEDQSRTLRRDPHSGYVAYAPIGSIKQGEQFVKTGGNGKSVACAICHGDSLLGLGNVPRIAGQHPGYIARQLYGYKNGSRNGGDAPLMKKAVAEMNDMDIVAISAYLGSLNPTR